MKITCLGATRTVTGSCFRLEMDNGDCYLVDCGLYQGGRQIEMRNLSTDLYRVADLKGIFITHAHLDHSGLVPRLVRMGYRGPVFATEATCDLLRILWLDSAHIQEMEAQWQSRKNKRKGKAKVDPLYETVDAENATALLNPIDMDTPIKPFDGVEVNYITAGHILGAASLHFTLQGKKGTHTVGFSGDLGRPGQLIVPDSEKIPRVDTLFMETTYGSRLHKSLPDSIDELITVINDAYREGGKVLIPAFAVERTQEILYTLAKAHREGRMPENLPVYLDSPLAINATKIFRQHPDFFDDETLALLEDGHTPMNLPTLTFTPKTEDSQKINEDSGPAVIIAGSGMANAGRIKHHLKHNLWRPNCHVVIVGFQAQGTTGRRLVEGATKVKIFREDVAVKAKIHTIGGFSAHADQSELLEWLRPMVYPGLNVNLIHGEETATLTFKQVAEERYPDVNFKVPKWKESLHLKAAGLPEEPAIEEVTPEAIALKADELRRRIRNMEELIAGGGLDAGALGTLEKIIEQAEKAAAS